MSQVRASRQFRITLDTNRYSVPAHYAGHALTLKTYPDRLCIYHGTSSLPATRAATTASKTSKTPIIPSHCWRSAKKRAISSSFQRVLPLSPWAEAYYLKMEERRLNPHHHVRKIVALSDIYDPQTVARAIEDALTYEAFFSGVHRQLVGATGTVHTGSQRLTSHPHEPISLR